jgi:hypothetical protein
MLNKDFLSIKTEIKRTQFMKFQGNDEEIFVAHADKHVELMEAHLVAVICAMHAVDNGDLFVYLMAEETQASINSALLALEKDMLKNEKRAIEEQRQEMRALDGTVLLKKMNHGDQIAAVNNRGSRRVEVNKLKSKHLVTGVSNKLKTELGSVIDNKLKDISIGKIGLFTHNRRDLHLPKAAGASDKAKDKLNIFLASRPR